MSKKQQLRLLEKRRPRLTVVESMNKARLDQANKRISQISGLAKVSWYALLGYLTYIFVTLLTVVDSDFFVPTQDVYLPIINVSIPALSLFWVAPSLGAALYINLHQQLSNLWEALSAARHAFGGELVRKSVYPWLVNDFALTYGRRMTAAPRPLDWLTKPLTGFLIWLAGPLVLFLYWWRSMVAHDIWLTLFAGIALLGSLYVGLTTWHDFYRKAEGRNRTDCWRFRNQILVIFLAALFTGIGVLRTAGTPVSFGQFSNMIPVSKANLSDIDLIPRPSDWRPHDAARTIFRESWCKRIGMAPEICGQVGSRVDKEPRFRYNLRQDWCREHPPLEAGSGCEEWFRENERRFLVDWRNERVSYLRSLPQLTLNGVDLRYANLQRTFMPRAFLKGAQLDGARLWETNLERAEMQSASFRMADFWGTWIDANLEYANLDGSIFRVVRLSPSWMACTSLRNVIMLDVNMEESNLSFPNWCGNRNGKNEISGWLYRWNARAVNFEGRRFGTTIFEKVDLSGAVNLTQEQLVGVVGDNETILPKDNEGNQLYIWSCWAEPPKDFNYLVERSLRLLGRSDLGVHIDKKRHQRETWMSQWLCSDSNLRRKIGSTD